MVKQIVTIMNPSGLHARPASTFVKEAAKFPCKVTVIKDGKEHDAKSIIRILTACIKAGDEIELVTDGESEQVAMDALVAAVQSGLGEQLEG